MLAFPPTSDRGTGETNENGSSDGHGHQIDRDRKDNLLKSDVESTLSLYFVGDFLVLVFKDTAHLS